MKNGGMSAAIKPERDALPRATLRKPLARHGLHCVSYDSTGAITVVL